MEEEFWEIEDKQHGWYYLFQQLDQVARANAGTQLIAKEPMNIIRNRYRDVLPIDDTRVKLNNTDCDYINANYVKEETVQRSYIMTQGPMGHTSSHFWQMVWEQNCAGIVMLNRCIEKGMNKCFQYWPAEVGQSLQFGPYIIENQFQQTEETFRLSMLTLSMSDSDEQVKTVQHFHYIKWPDFNVPRTPDDFLRFLNAVRRGGVLSPDCGPCVVHCSAGIGRSGTFALVDVILAQITKAGSTADINIQQTLLRMRTQRLGLIQTPDQLRFSYIAILHGADRACKGELDEDEDSDSDEDEEGVASENDSEEERTGQNDSDKPPPLPPRSSDSNKIPQVDLVKEDDHPPAVLKRTLSLSGSSSHSMSTTPELPADKEDDTPPPPPLPPRDNREPFLEEREEGNPPVEAPSSLNAENFMTSDDIHSTSEEATLRRRQAYQDKQARISTQVQDMKKNLQHQRGHSEQWTPKWLFIGVACIIFYLLLRALY